jgi:hypothetical protein
MTMQRIQLDISSDIFDKVIFFLENLPKNKVKLNLETILTYNYPKQDNQNLLFNDFLKDSQQVNMITKFDRDELHER